MSLSAYLSIARPDHWFKNVFMLLGVLLAFFVEPGLVHDGWAASLVTAVASACLVASSNYVLNEVLDAPRDRLHPTKRHRPVPSGLVSIRLALAEWLVLGTAGVWLGTRINAAFALSALALWVAGLLYNIPPVRTKDVPYLDVVSESINNPIRLFMGWFALIPAQVPPLSLTIAYWMGGAFLMGAKRFAEYRMIDDPQRAADYRSSFRHYNGDRLLLSLFFYATACAFFFGIFVIRYHLELILFSPLIAGFFTYYMKVSFKPDSPVQNPEKLYRERGLILYTGVCLAAFVLLLYTSIPALYETFNVLPARVNPLWVF